MAEKRRFRERAWLPALLILSAGVVAEEALPDMAFLEYLGSWEEDDAEWVALTDTRVEDLPRDAAEADDRPEEAHGDEQTN